MEVSRCAAVAIVAVTLLVASRAVADAPAPVIQSSPLHLSLARDVVEAMGLKANLAAEFRGFLKEQLSQVKQAETPDQKKIAVERAKFAEEWVEADVPELIKEVSEIYASEFTDSELQDIATFYRTDVGRLLVEKYPQWAATLAPEIAKDHSGAPIRIEDVEEIRLELKKTLRARIPMEFTSAQTDEIVAFMISSTGQKMWLKQQIFAQKALVVIQSMLRRLNHDWMEKWCDLTHCTPLMRSWIDHPELMNAPKKPN